MGRGDGLVLDVKMTLEGKWRSATEGALEDANGTANFVKLDVCCSEELDVR